MAADIQSLYERLMECWNTNDAGGFGDCFTADGSMVGFDGSCVESGAITAHLQSIFADHQPATYVWIVREERALDAGVSLLRSVAGMVPPGGDDLKAELNAVHALVAVDEGGDWKVAHFQNTPAAFHGRPEEAEALTDELRGVLGAGR